MNPPNLTADFHSKGGALYVALQNSAAPPYFYAPHHHFAFLISHFSFKQSFKTESKGSTPKGLTLNPAIFI